MFTRCIKKFIRKEVRRFFDNVDRSKSQIMRDINQYMAGIEKQIPKMEKKIAKLEREIAKYRKIAAGMNLNREQKKQVTKLLEIPEKTRAYYQHKLEMVQRDIRLMKRELKEIKAEKDIKKIQEMTKYFYSGKDILQKEINSFLRHFDSDFKTLKPEFDEIYMAKYY